MERQSVAIRVEIIYGKHKKPVRFCQNCGYESSKWSGRSVSMQKWNTFVEGTGGWKALSTSGKIKPATEMETCSAFCNETSDEAVPHPCRSWIVYWAGSCKKRLPRSGWRDRSVNQRFLLQVCPRNLSGQNLSF